MSALAPEVTAQNSNAPRMPAHSQPAPSPCQAVHRCQFLLFVRLLFWVFPFWVKVRTIGDSTAKFQYRSSGKIQKPSSPLNHQHQTKERVMVLVEAGNAGEVDPKKLRLQKVWISSDHMHRMHVWGQWWRWWCRKDTWCAITNVVSAGSV